MKRIVLVLLFALGIGCGSAGPQADPRCRAIARGARALWALQGEDGGWHSRTYGLLRSGQSLTPFVLNALTAVPPEIEPAPAGAVARALEFLRAGVDADGALGCRDPLLADYPNYATALGLEALQRTGGKDAALVERMCACLRRGQLADDLGWTPDQTAYGAWGMGGAPRRPPNTGRVDLSFTRHVLRALRAAGLPADDPAWGRAATFLERCRNADGGYFLSPVHEEINKAGLAEGRPRSYGTPTADAILALHALGAPADDARLRGAVGWLVAHHRVEGVPGIPVDDEAGWSAAMLHYYLAAAAQALRLAGIEEAPPGRDWRRDLVDALARTQRPDGTWCSTSFLMKEDDPLVATSFALLALEAAGR